MMRHRAGVAMILSVIAVVTVLVVRENPETAIAEDISKSQPEEQEFMEDKSFWSAVNQAQAKLQTQEHVPVDSDMAPMDLYQKEEVIEVKSADLAAVKEAAHQAHDQQAKADEMCEKAKRDVRNHSASSSKAKRDAAVKKMKAFCKKVQKVVAAEVAQDLKEITGKAPKPIETKAESQTASKKKEQAVFQETLGKMHITGKGAYKIAKSEAMAHALQRMAGKALAPDQGKANKACAKATLLAKKKGTKTAIAKAKVYCAKLQQVIANEKKMIQKDIQDTAAGKANPEAAEGGIEKVQQQRTIHEIEAQAADACKDAHAKANQVGTPKALAMAKEMCKHVKDMVAHQVANIMKKTVASDVAAKADAACTQARAKAHKLGAPQAKELAEALCKKVKAITQRAGSDTKTTPVAVETKQETKQSSVVDQANAACAEAKAKAKKLGAPQAKLLAKALCAKMKAVIQRAGGAQAPSTEEVEASDTVNTSEDKAPASKEEAIKQLADVAQQVHMKEMEEEEQARTMCKAAEKKVRDDAGVHNAAVRAQAVEEAIKFCKSTKKAIAEAEAKDNDTFAKVAKAEAKKYGLQVVKLKVKKQPTDSDVDAERKLIAHSIGRKQAKFMNDKQGVKEAKAEAVKNMVHKKLAAAKDKVDKHIKFEEAKISKTCAAVKKKIAIEDSGAKRVALLKQAVAACHRTQHIIANEKKKDYAELSILKKQVMKSVVKPTQKQVVKAAPAGVIKVKVMPEAPGNAHGDAIEGLGKTEKVLKQREAKMEKRTGILCAKMAKKVKALIAQKKSTMSQQEIKVLHQRTLEFCQRAKAALKREEDKDEAALQKAAWTKAQVSGVLGASKLPPDQRAAAAYAATRGLPPKPSQHPMKARSKKERKMDERKEGLMSRKQATKELEYLKDPKAHPLKNKAEAAAVQREQEVAKAALSKRKKATHSLHAANTKLSAAEKKRMKSDKHVQSIMKNLKMVRKSLTLVDETLMGLAFMAA